MGMLSSHPNKIGSPQSATRRLVAQDVLCRISSGASVAGRGDEKAVHYISTRRVLSHIFAFFCA